MLQKLSGDKSWLQTLRDHRGYVNYPLADDCDLTAEIEAEYRKEFIAEGQLFYYYKRLNYGKLPEMSEPMAKNIMFSRCRITNLNLVTLNKKKRQMMKKLGYIFLCMVALWGCQDNADYPFKGKDAVYFQLQTDDYYWTETLDSMVYTFCR